MKSGWIGLAFWVAACAIFIACFFDKLFSMSVDVGHHHVLVARLMESWSLPVDDPSLGDMAWYPRGSHLLASVPGRFLDSALAGIQVVALGSLFVLWTSVAFCLTGLPRHRMIRAVVVLAIALICFKLWLEPSLFGSELVENFAFSQLVAQSLILIVLASALHKEWRGTPRSFIRASMGLGAVLVTGIHLIPALELLGTLAVLLLLDALSGKPGRRSRELMIGAALIVVCATSIWIHPDFKAMRLISENNGSISLGYVSDMKDISVLAVLTATLSGLLILAWQRMGRSTDDYRHVLFKYLGAFGLSIAGLCLLQVVLYVEFALGSPYACYKYGFGLQSVSLINLAVLASLSGSRDGEYTSSGMRLFISTGMAVLACVCVLPTSPMVRSSQLITAERDARAFRDANAPSKAGMFDYAVDIAGISAPGNYLISISSLRAPRTSNAYDILLGRPIGDSDTVGRILTSPGADPWDIDTCRKGTSGSLVVIDAACVSGSLHIGDCAGTFNFSERRNIDLMVTGFPTSAPDGRWSEGSTGRFICRLPATRPTRALIATGALVTENHAQRMTVSVNKGVPHEFRYTHDSRAQTVSLPVPQDGSLELELVFTFPDAISPRELGLNSDPRQLAVFISHIRFE